jgi:hypothetical protein
LDSDVQWIEWEAKREIVSKRVTLLQLLVRILEKNKASLN